MENSASSANSAAIRTKILKMVLNVAGVAILCAAAHISCSAQLAGFRDVSENWRAPEDHLPLPPTEQCPEVKSTISNGTQNSNPAIGLMPASGTLRLTISALSPSELHPGGDFIATVELKNTGKSKVLVPWQPDGEQVTRTSADGSEEKYEVADVNFRIVAGKKDSLPIYLQSYGALFARPENRASYIELPPQHWVNIRFKGTVMCGLPDCSAEIKPDEHAILTATWYQRILTHDIHGCNENHGSSLIRQLDSTPLPVAIRSSGSSRATPNTGDR